MKEQPTSNLVLCRAAGWLDAPEGESRASTVALITRLVAEVERLRDGLQGCSVETSPLDIPCPHPGCEKSLWTRSHTHATGPAEKASEHHPV